MKDLSQEYVGTKNVRKCRNSLDPNKHTFIDYVDARGNYPDYSIRLPDKDVFVALDSLYYDIVDFLFDEYNQRIEEDRNIYNKQNYELVKKHLEILDIIKKKQVHIARVNKCDNVLQYNMGTTYEERYLTETEFNLIKEWLENGR